MQHNGSSSDDAKIVILVDVTGNTSPVLFETTRRKRRMYNNAMIGGYITRIECFRAFNVAFACCLVHAKVSDPGAIGMQHVLVRLQMEVEVLLKSTKAETE